jgi:phosphatidylglycerophosphatase A
VLAWTYAVLILAFVLVPTTGVLRDVTHLDKALHLAGFYLFVLFFCLGYGFHRRVLFLCVGVVWALTTEGLQALLPWRDFNLIDLLFDVLGAALVLLTPRRAAERIVEAIATFFFIGHAPVGPGTIAALVALGVFYLSPFDNASMPFLLPAVFILGTFASGRLAKREGEDPRKVVIDEVFGVLVAVAFLPKSLPLFALSFVLFRILDILKPFPIGFMERIRGGLGIMADDLAAGVFANLAVRVLLLFLPI